METKIVACIRKKIADLEIFSRFYTLVWFLCCFSSSMFAIWQIEFSYCIIIFFSISELKKKQQISKQTTEKKWKWERERESIIIIIKYLFILIIIQAIIYANSNFYFPLRLSLYILLSLLCNYYHVRTKKEEIWVYMSFNCIQW